MGKSGGLTSKITNWVLTELLGRTGGCVVGGLLNRPCSYFQLDFPNLFPKPELPNFVLLSFFLLHFEQAACLFIPHHSY